ncbi:ATP-binding protein, partial [Streptomyces sp. NPDC059456]
MSLPLTRRIARTALLLAAGAAPVVGAAGAASAAGLESVPQLGALTSPDAAGTAGDV